MHSQRIQRRAIRGNAVRRLLNRATVHRVLFVSISPVPLAVDVITSSAGAPLGCRFSAGLGPWDPITPLLKHKAEQYVNFGVTASTLYSDGIRH